MTAGAAYLDVRTHEEFNHGHPPSAFNIPFLIKNGSGPGDLIPNPYFASSISSIFPNKLSPIVVGCKNGNRSTPATVMIMHLGHANVVNQAGGFEAWMKAILPSVAEVVDEEE